MTTALLDALRSAVGPAHVLTDGDLTAYERDWRGRMQGKALAVVRPASTQEVAAVVKACAAAGTAIIPQGGNTGLSVGSTPDASGTQVVLNLTRMQAIRAVDADNLTITVEAGCILQNLQQAAQQAGFLFPLSLAAEGSCTIGGNLGANAGGTQVVRYGNTRELCLGLEVVTPRGDIWDGLTGLRKDNTGYDLRNLLIGSEGTLGIITAATMKLFPPARRPSDRLCRRARHGRRRAPAGTGAPAFVGRADRVRGDGAVRPVPGREAHAAVARALCRDGRCPYCVLLENSDSESEEHARQRFESLLELAFEDGCVLDAVVAENLTQAHDLWHVRESIPLAQAQEGLNIKHDISLPTSRIPAFVEHTDALLQREIAGVRLVNFGHLGDGNLHYNVQAPENADGKAFLHEQEPRVNALVYDAVAQFGGSFSAEHGVGQLKTEQLERYEPPVALAMMRAIKQALDPQNIMNPGCVLAKDQGAGA